MDCLDRSLSETETNHSATPPFQHIVTEQAKSFLALQELQNEVGALLEFRDLVMEAFPHLRHKVAATNTPTASHISSSSSGSKWEPGIRVRRKLGQLSREDSVVPSLVPRSRSNSHGKAPKSGENSSSAGSSAVQDSGFCTESKEHSASSSTTRKNKEVEDELMNLLDMIQQKGTALRLEVEYLQSKLFSHEELPCRTRRKCRSLENLAIKSSEPTSLSKPKDELFGLKKERDLLLQRVTDMEADNLQNLAQTNQLLAEVGVLSAEKRFLEERLQDTLSDSHNSPLLRHSSPHSSHYQPCFTPVKHFDFDDDGREMSSTNPFKETQGVILDPLSSPRTPARPTDPISRKFCYSTPTPSIPKTLGALDGIVSSPSVQMKSPRGVKLSRYKVAAILKESNPLELQRHLLTTCFQNEVLNYQVDNVTKSRMDLVCQLAKIKEENEDLKFQLEEKKIELEGTRARVRLYERLQTHKMNGTGDGTHTLMPANPILPHLTLPCGNNTGGDTDTGNLLSSSTESAHHDEETNSVSSTSMDKLSHTNTPSRKRMSKIPLKSYVAPKPPEKINQARHSVTSSIPKYQKDNSWNSNHSKKSTESLNNGSNLMPTSTVKSTRDWDVTTKSVSVKKPAIISNKELSISNRLDKQNNAKHYESFSRKIRKVSSESSVTSNSYTSSSSSPRYTRDVRNASPVIKKLSNRSLNSKPNGDTDTKVRPATKFTNFFSSWIKSSGLS